MNSENAKLIKEKFIKGINIAFERLLLAKQREDSEIVFSKDGRIVKIKARDFNLRIENQ